MKSHNKHIQLTVLGGGQEIGANVLLSYEPKVFDI